MKIGAVILAGGKSRRMNYNNKSFLSFDGETFIEKIIHVLERKFDDIIIIANDESSYLKYKKEVYKDIYVGKGPMAGIHSALKNSKNDYVFVVATDMPFVSEKALELILGNIENHEIVVPMSAGKLHPLCGVYSKNILPKIEKSLEAGNYKLIDFLLTCNTFVVNGDEIKESFRNINTPEDYNKMEMD